MRPYFRPPRGLPRGRGRGNMGNRFPLQRGGNRNFARNLDYSSSYSYSDDDNIPVIRVINTKAVNSTSDSGYDHDHEIESNRTQTKRADLVSDSDYSENLGDGTPVTEDVTNNQNANNMNLINEKKNKNNSDIKDINSSNWSPQRNPSNNANKTSKPKVIIGDYYDYSDSEIKVSNTNGSNSNFNNNHADNKNFINNINNINNNININNSNDNSSDVNNNNDNSNVHDGDLQIKSGAAPNTLMLQTDNVNSDQKIEEPTISISPSPPDPLDTTYQIIWKKLGRLKSNITFCQSTDILFHSKETRTDIGKCFVICSDSNVDRYSSAYLGSLKKSQGMTRFTLFAPMGEQYQTRDGEVMGLSFFNQKDTRLSGVRAFRIAIPKVLPYFPASKEMNLSKIAQSNIQSDDILIFHTKMPELLPGPILKLQFGSVHVVSSVKNFIIEDENHRNIFMIYKSSDEMCSVKFAPPITALMAFSIAIAAIASRK